MSTLIKNSLVKPDRRAVQILKANGYTRETIQNMTHPELQDSLRKILKRDGIAVNEEEGPHFDRSGIVLNRSETPTESQGGPTPREAEKNRLRAKLRAHPSTAPGAFENTSLEDMKNIHADLYGGPSPHRNRMDNEQDSPSFDRSGIVLRRK